MLTKKDELIKIYSGYKCSKGHQLKWKGKAFLDCGMVCEKCKEGMDDLRLIRWGCDSCQEYYCTSCFIFYTDDYCPGFTHKLAFSTYSAKSEDFICDKCLKSTEVKDGIWIDKDCNFSVCVKCQNDGKNLPYIFED